MMEKHSWHRVHLNLIANSQPVPRWGHSCCVIGNEIVFFGGYAQSIYMNDVWSFNTTTMEWTQIKTTGDIPSQRSNCTMSYDSQNDRVIVFGGGGPNKKRFNTINILNWMTKQWIEIHPKQNQSSPWERTYHAAQLFYPYLVVFGGEGVSDIDDLWVFNFMTLSWQEIPIDKSAVRPCARRFHSSVRIGNQFFIIGGCHGKYRCLSDIYSLDLTPLLENGDIENLVWVNRKPLGSAFLTRWGHSTAVYDKKIYIFGGRFSNDLNDLLVFDPEKNTIKNLKTSVQLPKARRRHSACFIGSCMIIFGGFNGEYYNDLNYINVFQLKSKFQTPNSNKIQSIEQLLNNSSCSDGIITSQQGKKLFIHKGLLQKGFSNNKEMQQFIELVNTNETEETISDILKKIYLGYGDLDQSLRSRYSIEIPESQQEYQEKVFEQICPNMNTQIFSRIGKRRLSQIPTTIALADDQFSEFLEHNRQKVRKDINLIINKTYIIPSNKATLSVQSEYFRNLTSVKYKQYSPIQGELQQVHICLPECPYGYLEHTKSVYSLKQQYTPNIVLFQILLNYLLLEKVVIPVNMTLLSWFQLYSLAEYFCISRLMSICEKEICLLVDQHNCQKVLKYSVLAEMQVLTLYCSDYFIKTMINRGGQVFMEQEEQIAVSDTLELKKKTNDVLQLMYNLARFDILQVKLERMKIMDDGMKRKQSQSTQDEKQNYEINGNY